jgi:hypothetical protein
MGISSVGHGMRQYEALAAPDCAVNEHGAGPDRVAGMATEDWG